MAQLPSLLREKRWPWLVAAAVVVTAFLASVIDIQPPRRDPRPQGGISELEGLAERDDVNVLFVLIDTLRADRLGAYGYARDTSPRLDQLAATGVRFSRHLAQSSWTKCSMASLWTGLYPLRNGVTRYNDVLPDEAVLAAEILQDAGFQTVGLYRNGWVAPTFGFGQGFSVYSRPATRRMDASIRRENPTISLKGTDEDAVASALEYLRIRGDDRWFLYLHLMDVHEYLYDAESALFGGTYSDIYDNSIRWVDGAIEALLAGLEDQGHAANTLVVIASDHGEAFRERGIEGHARAVFRESTEVPLLFSFPFQLDPGIQVSARTRNVDIWPTLLDLLGLEMPGDLDGRSLRPEILASARNTPLSHEPVTGVAHLDQNWGRTDIGPRPTVAVAEGPLRYVRSERGPRRAEALFDSEQDPPELDNIADAHPEAVVRLRALADTYLTTSPVWGPTPKREIGELELNQLRALGYAIP